MLFHFFNEESWKPQTTSGVHSVCLCVRVCVCVCVQVREEAAYKLGKTLKCTSSINPILLVVEYSAAARPLGQRRCHQGKTWACDSAQGEWSWMVVSVRLRVDARDPDERLCLRPWKGLGGWSLVFPGTLRLWTGYSLLILDSTN